MTVSIVILTKDRAQLLNLCLTSLANQTVPPDEIIVVDNNSTDKTKSIINKFKNKLPISCQTSTSNSLPYLYNSGIKQSNSEIIACLDDDCKVNKNWVKNIIKAHTDNPDVVIQGKVISYPNKNIYVKIMANHYKNWLRSHLIGNGYLSVIDTKNVSFPKKIIKENLFLESLNKGSHDIELGKRLFNKHIKILYVKNIIVWHKEREAFKDFVSQHWRIAQSEAVLKKDSKDNKIRMVLNKKNLWSLLDMVKMVAKEILGFNPYVVLQLPFIYLTLFIVRVAGFGYVWLKSR